MLRSQANMVPISKPGMENPMLYSHIMPMSILFLKPRALNIPY